MKKLATQTLATLVIIGVMSMSSVNTSALQRQASGIDPRVLKDLERVYHAHDRRFELRASVLGVAPDELRDQLRKKSLETIVKKYGFKDVMAFYTAVTGKLKAELRARGWSERRLDTFVTKRIDRVSHAFAPMSLATL